MPFFTLLHTPNARQVGVCNDHSIGGQEQWRILFYLIGARVAIHTTTVQCDSQEVLSLAVDTQPDHEQALPGKDVAERTHFAQLE